MNMILGGAMSESGQRTALLACNEYTRRYRLTLTAEDAAMLTETQREALRTAGRVEFTGGAVEKIVTEFAASPYITQASFAATLAALTELFYTFKLTELFYTFKLTELFYTFKNETSDLIGDEALIKYMRRAFNVECSGSVEALAADALPELARRVNRYRARGGLTGTEGADE